MELFQAAASNNLLLVKERIEKGDSAKWQNVNDYEMTPLHKICSLYNKKNETSVEILKVLLSLDDSRIDVNQKDRSGCTALHFVCRDSNLEMVRLLLDDKRVNANAINSLNWTPFHYACSNGNLLLIQEMANRESIDLNFSRQSSKIPIFQTCQRDKSKAFIFLFCHPRVKINPKIGWELLFECINCQAEDSVKLMVKDERIDLNESDGQMPLLIYVCSRGFKGMAMAILDSGRNFNINITDENGATALFYCCFYGHEEIVERLLQSPDLDVNQPNRNQASAFYVACQNGRSRVVEMMMKDSRVNLNQPQNLGVTPFFKACQQGHLDIVEKMLSDGRVDISISWKETNWSPLMMACYKGKLDVVKSILSSGRKLDLSQGSFVDLFQITVGDKIHQITKKSQENQQTRDQIITSLKNFSTDPINFAVSLRKQRNLKELTMEQKFIFACADGDLEEAKRLIEKGVDAKIKDENGFDALFFATFRNQSAIINFIKSL